jgi:hypothetical protein
MRSFPARPILVSYFFAASACVAVLPWQGHSQVAAKAAAAPPLTLHCTAERTSASWAGGFRISASADGTDNRPLTYSYSVSSGKVVGSGPAVAFEWGSPAEVSVEVTCSVTDDSGRSAEDEFTVMVGLDVPLRGKRHEKKRAKPPIGADQPPESWTPPPPSGARPPPVTAMPPPPVTTAPRPVTAAPPPSIAAFPWPPPQASSRVVLAAWPRGPQMRVFGDIDSRLTSALRPKGYVERSYYSVPGGFALVTRLEQIYSDGRSMPPPARFSAQLLPPSRFSDYLRALFNADPGFYRVIVFIVTDQGSAEGAQGPSEADADKWIHDGIDILPSDIASHPLTDGVRCVALIYQFRQSNASNAAKAELIPKIDPVANLSNAGLWEALN